MVLLTLVVAAPPARATGEVVQLRDVHAPARTAADHPFPLYANVTNHDAQDRTVDLFAALYEPGSTPCGSAADPRFRTYTPLVQARLVVPAGATVAYPAPGDSWLQRYQAKDVPAGDATMELCVFAGEDAGAGSTQVQYDDYLSQPLATRGVNHPPVGSFVTTSDGASYRFEATGDDADGDALTFAWRFETAAGPRLVSGPTAVMSYPVAGTYDVTLTVSDGFDQDVRTGQVHVATQSQPVQAAPVPLPLALTPAALLLALLLRPRPPAP
jgi:hypothetical protein